MPGRFSRDNRPILPGAYFNIEPTVTPAADVATASIVAIPITHDWGPVETATLVTSPADFDAKFGNTNSPGRRAVHSAFRGEDVPGWAGAGAVLVYRMVGTAGVNASKTLTNTTPATAVTLTARYAGNFGNNIKVAVVDTASNAAYTDLIIYNNTVEVERWTFLDADTQGLVDSINAGSDWVTATRQAAGPLTLVATPSALTSGNDGSTLIAADWTDAMTKLEIERFAVLAPFDLTDSTIIEALRAWAVNLNRQGTRFRTVVGGASGDTATTAIARTAALQNTTYPESSADFINLGDFVVQDSIMGTVTSAQMAPRYAGILAQRGEVHSATSARLGGVTAITTGPSKADLVNLFKGGVVSVLRDSDPDSPVKFSGAVTAYTQQSSAINAQFPYTVFRNPKFVATMQGIETETTAYAESYVVGKIPINGKSRDALVGEMQRRLDIRVDAQVIQPGPTAQIDTNPPPTDDDEFIALVYTIKFGRTAEQVYGTLRVS